MTALDPVEIQIPVPWGHLTACWYGNRRQRPLVAVHGWQDNAGSFARLAPILAKQIPLLVIELPGHGRSSHLPPGIMYHIQDLALAIRLVLEHFKWPRISFIAHSMGAIICFYFSSFYPGRTDLIINLDQLHPFCLPTNSAIMVMQISIERTIIETERLQLQLTDRFEHQPPLYTMPKLEVMLMRSSLNTIAPENCKYILERTVLRSSENQDLYYFTRDNRTKAMVVQTFELDGLIYLVERLVGVNLLFLSAKNLHYLQPAPEIVTTLKKCCHVYEHHELDGVTHYMHLNNPDECAHYIKPFLARHWITDPLEVAIVGAPLSKL